MPVAECSHKGYCEYGNHKMFQNSWKYAEYLVDIIRAPKCAPPHIEMHQVVKHFKSIRLKCCKPYVWVMNKFRDIIFSFSMPIMRTACTMYSKFRKHGTLHQDYVVSVKHEWELSTSKMKLTIKNGISWRNNCHFATLSTTKPIWRSWDWTRTSADREQILIAWAMIVSCHGELKWKESMIRAFIRYGAPIRVLIRYGASVRAFIRYGASIRAFIR